MQLSRRDLLASSTAAASLAILPSASALGAGGDPWFQISLAQWSLHRRLRAGELDPLDFAAFTKREFDISAVEYVNSFFKDKAGDFDYLGQLKQRAADSGVKSLLIMVDGEGSLADADDAKRRKAIENHFRWLAAAAFLGCHSIRVNAGGSGSAEDMAGRAADSLVRLAEVATPYGLNIIVENHGGRSSNGAWLAGVMSRANHPRVGTLPDFGNFRVGKDEHYDRYKGVTELMPYAKAVSAKSHDFDESGQETHTDYLRMMGIVKAAGYGGYVGVEFEGGGSEMEGIRATKKLLVKVREELS
ncbi:MAG: L-ribulose-5-phosphate 3-epimerase [Planctomycetota bacterium]|jgi:L-ribulose-5-phosphate 3-epimerase